MKYTFFLLAFVFVACSQEAVSQKVIDATELESLTSKNPTIQLVDLRTPGEVQQTGIISGAVVINFNAPDFQTKIAQLDKSKPVIVYCAAGGRSPRAALQMVQMGFRQVYDYTGGMNDWKSKGKKTVR